MLVLLTAGLPPDQLIGEYPCQYDSALYNVYKIYSTFIPDVKVMIRV